MNQIASSKLAHTLQKRAKNVNYNDSIVYTDIGTIVADNGLKLDTFEPVIPSDGYSRCKAASELEKGDRVLLVWANGEPVIIDKIV